MPSPKHENDDAESAFRAVQRYLQRLHDKQCESATGEPGGTEFAHGHETAIIAALSYVDSCLKLRRAYLDKRRKPNAKPKTPKR
jgi:hypothetical protein